MTSFSYTPIAPGIPSDVAHVNTPFTNLANIINGGIEGSNLANLTIPLGKMAANSVDASKIVNGSVGNDELAASAVDDAKVAAAAAIAYAKLALTGSIVNADVATAAAILVSKLAAGTDGQVLSTVGSTPTWVTVPRARARHSVTVALTSGADTVIALDTEDFDTDTIHDLATNNSRLTCKTAGTYLIVAGFRLFPTTSEVSLCRVDIRKNGTTLLKKGSTSKPSTGTARELNPECSTLAVLAVNDYVELVANQVSGGSQDVTGGAENSPVLEMVRVA